jgi:hypothetical protein
LEGHISNRVFREAIMDDIVAIVRIPMEKRLVRRKDGTLGEVKKVAPWTLRAFDYTNNAMTKQQRNGALDNFMRSDRMMYRGRAEVTRDKRVWKAKMANMIIINPLRITAKNPQDIAMRQMPMYTGRDFAEIKQPVNWFGSDEIAQEVETELRGKDFADLMKQISGSENFVVDEEQVIAIMS